MKRFDKLPVYAHGVSGLRLVKIWCGVCHSTRYAKSQRTSGRGMRCPRIQSSSRRASNVAHAIEPTQMAVTMTKMKASVLALLMCYPLSTWSQPSLQISSEVAAPMPPTDLLIFDPLSPTASSDVLRFLVPLPDDERVFLTTRLGALDDADLQAIAYGIAPEFYGLQSLVVEFDAQQWRILVQAYAQAILLDRQRASDNQSRRIYWALGAALSVALTFLGWFLGRRSLRPSPAPTSKFKRQQQRYR